MASSIICLSETSLNDPEWHGWDAFRSFNVYQKCRGEAYESEELNQRKSGGVAILINKKELSKRASIKEMDNMEMVSVKTKFPICEGRNTTLSLLYRDHKMSNQQFNSKLSSLFKSHEKEASLLLGDFNVNMLQNESILETAENYGFHSIVDSGTTINNHLLDQVFLNVSAEKLKVVVLPAYFSDHHLVIICIPKTFVVH